MIDVWFLSTTRDLIILLLWKIVWFMWRITANDWAIWYADHGLQSALLLDSAGGWRINTTMSIVDTSGILVTIC